MSNKYWKENDKGAWYLYFDPYDYLVGSDAIILRMVEDSKDKNCWNYISEELNVEQDFFEADDLEEAKEIAENMIKEFYEDKVSCYEELLELWNKE